MEVLLRQLHDQHGIPVSIFRCGMILAHTRRAGHQAPAPVAQDATAQKPAVSETFSSPKPEEKEHGHARQLT